MPSFEVINNNEKEKWNRIVKSFPDYDIYYLNEYIKPFLCLDKTEAFLIYFKNEKTELCYVVEKSDVSNFKSFCKNLDKKTYFDLSTPYGYGGPLVKNYNYENIKLFFDRLTKWAKSENIVSQFIRFHPLIENHKFFADFIEIKTFKKTVYLALDDEETIYKNMDLTCRRHVKRALKNNITVSINNSKEAQNNFIKLYIHTMKRNNATDYYYFNDKFYEETFSNLGKNSNLFNAYYNGEIISSAIIFNCNNNLHYHLAASNKDYMNLCSNKLLVYEVALWGVKNGYKKFHMGGGNEAEDSLFTYKRSFNKGGLKDFYIGRNIFDIIKYSKLMSLRKEFDQEFNLETPYLIGYRA